MKSFINNKLAAALALGLAVSFTGVGAAQVYAADTSVAVQVEVKQSKDVDWTKGADSDVTAVGLGYPPENVGNRGTVLARRAAIVDAYRLLAESIKGVSIDSETTVDSLILSSDIVKARVNALVQGAKIVEEGSYDDGSYYVKMSVPLFGVGKSVANAVLPEATKDIVETPVPVVDESKTPLTKEEVQEIKSVAYTGIIVDASGLGLEPTFSPLIVDKDGRVVYGMANIDKDFAISKGMVEYAIDAQEAAGGSTRAGTNPLVIKAVSVKGGVNSINPVNVVVSVEDADKILLAFANSKILDQCAVTFVK